MNKILLVIDVQKCFINENTKDLPKKIENLISKNLYSHVLFTKFINYKDSVYASRLGWEGCIDDDEQNIVMNTFNYQTFNKTTYSAFNDVLIEYIRKNKISEIYLCGIDTECCILKTAFDMFEAGYNVYVLKDYCGCMYGIRQNDNALEILKRNIGKDYII